MNRLGKPEDQPVWTEGYEAYLNGRTKNPFENLSIRFQSQKIYWDMGWESAKFVSEESKKGLEALKSLAKKED